MTMALRHASDIPGRECQIQNVNIPGREGQLAQSGLRQFELIHLIKKFSK